MVFSSPVFLYYFLPAALALYFGAGLVSTRLRNGTLALLGYAFYGWANPRFVVLMLGTTLVDWLLSLAIAADSADPRRAFRNLPSGAPPHGPRSRLQRSCVALSVVSNLSMLGFFKYFNFGVDTYNALLAAMGQAGLQWHDPLRVALPIGISFYVFQSLSYTIDVYRGEAKVMRNFIDFACFVSMFPHLVAGPILKFAFLARQLESRSHTLEKFARGAAFFMLGLAKKVLLANPCGQVADVTFAAAARHALDAWWGLLAYAFQIYFDFSGYSDMAIGLGLMLGFVFARNFDNPYRAASITEFWRRWHISLSTWLRLYLYIPLGGNRKGTVRTYVNLTITMLLGGLWHGASWTFVAWGGLHGLMLAAERRYADSRAWGRVPRALRVAATFGVVLVSWVVFRSPSFPDALSYLRDMMGLATPYAGALALGVILYNPYYATTLAVAAIAVWVLPDTWDLAQKLTPPRAVVFTIVFVLSLLVLTSQTYNPFIYFRF